jgi:N,N-dimethylformamidase beta subunit-like, C-terminal
MVVAPWRPSLALPTAGWPPGSYLLRLDASSGAQQYVPLVIRSPSAAGRVVLVQPTTTYQAYNLWGG